MTTEYVHIFVLFHLRCLINCDKIASESTRISLTTTCTGHACKTAKYQWKLVTVNSNGGDVTKLRLMREMTETGLNLTGIIIKKNQLRQLDSNLFYRLEVKVSQQDGSPGYAAYQFRMNAPPTPGKCTVTPTSGNALKTQFVFTCIGWQVRLNRECRLNCDKVREDGVYFQIEIVKIRCRDVRLLKYSCQNLIISRHALFCRRGLEML